MTLQTLILRPTPETSRMIRTKEAALYLAMSEKQLRRLVRLQQIPVIQRGNVWLFRVADLDAYIAKEAATSYPLPAGTNGFRVKRGDEDYVQ